MKPGAQATRIQSGDFQIGMGNVCCGWAQLTGPYPFRYYNVMLMMLKVVQSGQHRTGYS